MSIAIVVIFHNISHMMNLYDFLNHLISNMKILNITFDTLTTLEIIIRAPPLKMREPYSNHLVCPSVRLSTLRCNAITRKVFDLETSYFIHRWRIKKGRHL